MEEEFKKKLPVFALSVTECTDQMCDATETNFISMVETPAIEVNYIAFSKEQPKPHSFKIQDSEQHKLIGPLMLADTPIYRKNPDTGEEYYVTFDSQAIENSVKNFTKKGYNSHINMNHADDVEGAYLMESWIVTDPANDKSKAYGFKGITKGSWFGIVYCPNKAVWDTYIKSGVLKGFSVEGMYSQSSQPVDYFNSQKDGLTKEEWAMIDELARILGE